MQKIASQTPVLLILLMAVAVFPAWSQLTLSTSAPLKVELPPDRTETMQLTGEPGSLQVIEVRLEGGLVGLESPETVRRVLDLGRGGRVLFAVQVPASGVANVEVTSAERLRVATLSLQVVTGDYTPEQRMHLHSAGVAFALADSTRRHQPHAPETTTALKDYDLAAAEAEAAGDVSLQRWALAQKGRFLLYQKSSFVTTRELLEHAASLPGKDEDPAVQALLYKTLSSCEYFLGDLAAAVTDGERALALYRETGDVYWQGIVLGNLIANYGELGRIEEASTAAHEALADAEETQDTAGVVFCLTELANLYRQQGQLQPAFQAFRGADVWLKEISYAPLVQAEIEQAEGQFYMDLGLWSEAQEQLQRCLQHAPAASASALQARGLLAQAFQQQGDVRRSLGEYTAAIASARKVQLAPEEASLLLGRSAAFLRAQQPAEALKDAQTAAGLAEAQKAPELQIQTALAQGAAYVQSGGPSSALATRKYRQALEWIEQTGEREAEATAYAGLARVEVRQGDEDAALGHIEQALTLLERSRASFSSHDLAASLFEARHTWYEFATDIALRLEHKYPGRAFLEAAFRYSERGRARAMLDALGDAGSTISPRSTELQRRIAANDYKVQAAKAELLTGSDSRSAGAQLKNLYREQDALDAEEQNGESMSGKLGISSVADVQRDLLKDDSALISFASGENSSYRWVITPSSVRVDVLPSIMELNQRLAPLVQALLTRRPYTKAGEDASQYASRVTAFKFQLDRRLEQAGALLLPVLPRRIHHLYIVTNSSLMSVPWNALRISCESRPCYAVERYSVSAEPSASVALALAARPSTRHLADVLVVSNPLRIGSRFNLRWSSLGSLPGAGREAQAIARETPPGTLRVLSAADATVENISSALQGDIRVAHFATHTVLVYEHPELSGIALSTGRHATDAARSVLWLHDIPHLHAPPLVVLSGCETQGRNFAGEELNTLSQAFFYAGAQQVVASSWAVDDDATASLMADLYHNLLQQKLSAADALRSAQLQALHAGASVEDWAPFVVDGVPANAESTGKVKR